MILNLTLNSHLTVNNKQLWNIIHAKIETVADCRPVVIFKQPYKPNIKGVQNHVQRKCLQHLIKDIRIEIAPIP